MRHFLKDKAGNFAIMFAIASVPLIGAAGVAADYSRAINIRSFMQSQTDAAALAAAQLGPTGNQQPHLDYLSGVTYQRYGEDKGISGLSVSAAWLGSVDYRVDMSGQMPVSLLGGVPGFPSHVALSVSSTVRVAEPRYVYKAPTVSELDNEAGDYNRIYVYCFDPEVAKANGGGQAQREKARTEMIPIADNGGTKYTFEMPRCNAGQHLSFRLMNVRLVRDQPSKWDSKSAQRFDYYTDTEIKNGAEVHDLGGWSVLETVLCNSMKECKPKSQGGIIPEGKNRSPQKAKASCSPGKYMYYGWEDRPPGMSGPSKDWTDVAWTDKDYDDIRIVIGCPELEPVEERSVRLVK